MKMLLFLLLAAAMTGAYSQDGRQRYERPQRGGHQMSQEERQRMREDMREAYRDRERSRRPERAQREMSPQERDKLREDIRDANRSLKR